MRVFKYRGGPESVIERDLKSLVADVFYASTSKELNDPFELMPDLVTEPGSVRRWLAHADRLPVLRGMFADLIEIDDKVRRSADLVRELLSSMGIYSLSKSGTNELLWAHYGHSHSGFCIEYDLDILLSLRGGRAIEVAYEDRLPKVSTAGFWKTLVGRPETGFDSLVKQLFATKSSSWAYEREVRILTNRGLNGYDFRAVKAVHFGHRCLPQVVARVMQALAGRDLRYFVVEPHAGKFALSASPLEDPYADAKTYRANMAPVRPGAIDYRGSDVRIRKLIEVAVEVVRRDPYCSYVLKATFNEASNNRPDRARVDYVRSDGEGLQVVRTFEQLESIDVATLKSSDFHAGDFYGIRVPGREESAEDDDR